MCGQQCHCEQGQGVHELVVHAGMEYRQILTAQTILQAMCSESTERYTGKAEEGGEHEEGTKHGRTPARSV
ncbi:hypothetical protein D3C75_1307940 [compost metagenome]